MSRVYSISHPEIVVDPSAPIMRWNLSEKGLRRLELL